MNPTIGKPDPVGQMADKCQQLMNEVHGLFKQPNEVTLIIRRPGHRDQDVLFTNDSPEELVRLIGTFFNRPVAIGVTMGDTIKKMAPAPEPADAAPLDAALELRNNLTLAAVVCHFLEHLDTGEYLDRGAAEGLLTAPSIIALVRELEAKALLPLRRDGVKQADRWLGNWEIG